MPPWPYCKVCLLAVGFSIEKSGDISESALFVMGASQIEGHRPYFMLLLEESWYASPEFRLRPLGGCG